MDNFSIALLFIFFVIFFIIIMNYTEQETKEGFYDPYPKEENKPLVINTGYGPLDSPKSISNAKLTDRNDYVVTSSDKIIDDYNRLVYPNQVDQYVPYGDIVCNINN